MRRALPVLLALIALPIIIAPTVMGGCQPSKMDGPCCWEFPCEGNLQVKEEYWGAYFEGNTQHTSVPWVRGYSIVASCQSHNCWPDFMPATVTSGWDSNGNPTWNWEKLVYNKDSSCNRPQPALHSGCTGRAGTGRRKSSAAAAT